MKAIAKYHCPEILDQLPIKVNVGSDKESKIHVQLKSDKSKIVSIMEWVVKKKHVLQLKHDWFDDYECQGKIREIEEKMFSSSTAIPPHEQGSSTSSCSDELVQLVAVKNHNNDCIL